MTGKLGQKCNKVMVYHRDEFTETKFLLLMLGTLTNLEQNSQKKSLVQIWAFEFHLSYGSFCQKG